MCTSIFLFYVGKLGSREVDDLVIHNMITFLTFSPLLPDTVGTLNDSFWGPWFGRKKTTFRRDFSNLPRRPAGKEGLQRLVSITA